MEIKTTEQISEDYEYETLHCETLRDISLMGETRWVRVDDVKKALDEVYHYHKKCKCPICQMYKELSQSNPSRESSTEQSDANTKEGNDTLTHFCCRCNKPIEENRKGIYCQKCYDKYQK